MRWAGGLLVVVVLIGGVVLLVRARQETPPTNEPPAPPIARAEPKAAPKVTLEAAKSATASTAYWGSTTPIVPSSAPPVWGGVVAPIPPATVAVSAQLPPPANLGQPPAPVAPALPAIPAVQMPVVPAGGAALPTIPSTEPKLPPLPATALPRLPDVPQPVDLAPKPAIPPVIVSKLKPLASAPDKVAAIYLNQSRMAVDYEVTKKGPSGLGMVELWIKDANGWSKATTVKSGEPLEADLPTDGAYGAKVVPVSGQGIRGAEPKPEAEPDLWVVRDTTAPEVDIKVRAGSYWGDEVSSGTPFIVELTAKDANLACDTLVIVWSEGDKPATALFTAKEMGQEKIETKLGVFTPLRPSSEKGEKKPANASTVVPASAPVGVSMSFTWKPVPGVPARVNFTASVKDKAGNLGGAGQSNIGTDLTAPAAKVTGVRGVGR